MIISKKKKKPSILGKYETLKFIIIVLKPYNSLQIIAVT